MRPRSRAGRSPAPAQCISGASDSTLKVWDIEKGQELLTLKGHVALVFRVAFTRNGRRIVSSGHDKIVMVWDAEMG